MATTRLLKISATALCVFALCGAALAQDGLAGELDDLLGLGDDDDAAEAAVENVEAAPAAEAAAAVEEVEAVEKAADAVVEEVEAAPAAEAADAVENVEAAADAAVEAVEKAADAVVEEVEAAPAAEAADAVENVEAAADAAVEAVDEAADAAVEKVEAVEEAEDQGDDGLAALLAADEEKGEDKDDAEANEAAPAAEAADAAVEKVEAAADAAVENVEEAVADAKADDAAQGDDGLAALLAADGGDEAEEGAEEVAAVVDEEPAAEEKAEAVAEAEPEDELGDLLAPAEEKAEEKAEAVAEAEPADELGDLLAPVEDEPVEPVEAAADAAVEEVEAVADAAGEDAEGVEAAADAAVEGAEAPAAEADDAEKERMAEISEIETLERVRKQALEKHGRASLENARKEMKDGNFVEAQRLYEEAVKFITNRPGNEKLIDEAEQGVAESIYRQAIVMWKKEVLDEAIKLARQARDKNHPKANQLISDIQNQIDNPPKPPKPKVVKRWKESAYKDNMEEVRTRIAKAREYYVTGEYDLANREVELILKNNPYNKDAIALRRLIAQRDYDFRSDEYAATRDVMIDAVREKWTPDRYAIDVVDYTAKGDTGTTTGKEITDPSGKTPEQVTADKMAAIVIPEINFRAANINDVIAFFEQASRDYDDQQIPPERRGVNLILKLNQQAAPAEAAIPSDDPWGQAETAVNTGGVQPVTFSARFMSLYEALKVITEISGLKFRIRGNIVMIMPLDTPDEDMISRTYTVLPSIEERASSMSTSLTASRAESNGFMDPADISSDNSGQVNWKQLFEDMGVKWPTGSSIAYLPSINKMRVLNTPENLIEFEKTLQELNVTPRQVEIEARFVEVGQTDLDALGLEWNLTDNWELLSRKSDKYQYISVDKGSGTGYKGSAATSPLRYMTAAGSSFNQMLDVNDGILKVSSHWTNPEIELILHALSQKSNTDLLSAPKVVTMNMQEAIIKVVTEYIYPTDYELEEYDSSGDSDNVQNVYPAVQPSGFEMREVGVILQVVPEVSEDGQMISLQLSPQIISEPEWEDYGFEYPKGAPDADGNMETYHIAMRQPLFKVRSVNTKVSIYNGATVVMGGMITENRIEVQDKVPVLGDIPLIGRLFRSTYEKSEKRNLLIFVTARMVDPAGRTVRSETADGEGLH